jgi:Asp-tRNA(Asn)/Glu-tRNA(Gln) amidotransferase A subunit family amidase
MTFPLDVNEFLDPSPIDVSSLKIGVTADFGGLLVSDHVRTEFRQRVDVLEQAGAEVTHLSLDLCDAVDVDWQLRADVFATQYHREIGQFDDTFNPNVFRTYETALSTTVLEIAKARRRQIELFRAVDEVFDDVDLLICPGVSVPPFPWNSLHPTEIDGQPVGNYMAWLGLTASLTVVGHPVVALPAGLDTLQLPFGIQCVGPMYSDAALLRTTRGIEECFEQFDVTHTPRPDVAAIVAADPKCQELGRLAAIAAAK